MRAPGGRAPRPRSLIGSPSRVRDAFSRGGEPVSPSPCHWLALPLHVTRWQVTGQARGAQRPRPLRSHVTGAAGPSPDTEAAPRPARPCCASPWAAATAARPRPPTRWGQGEPGGCGVGGGQAPSRQGQTPGEAAYPVPCSGPSEGSSLGGPGPRCVCGGGDTGEVEGDARGPCSLPRDSHLRCDSGGVAASGPGAWLPCRCPALWLGVCLGLALPPSSSCVPGAGGPQRLCLCWERCQLALPGTVTPDSGMAGRRKTGAVTCPLET